MLSPNSTREEPRLLRSRTGRTLSPPNNFIQRAFKRRANSTIQLMNAGRGHQAPRKATHLFKRTGDFWGSQEGCQGPSRPSGRNRGLPLRRRRGPSLFCLFFCLLYFFLPSFEELGCFSGCLMSSAGIQKLFCGICSMFKCSFDEFVRSLSYVMWDLVS